MNKIIVVGSSGSGKSTFSKQLSAKLQIPYIEMDYLFWKPQWTEPGDEEFFEKILASIDRPKWVLDGNYGRSHHLTWKDADTVIWLDLPFWLTLYQNVSRSVKRAIIRKELWKGTGNKESFLKMFSKDSIVLWLIKTYDRNVKRYEERMKDPKYSHIRFIRLRSRREVKRFLAEDLVNI